MVAAAVAAGGIYALDALLLEPDTQRRKAFALREQAARTENAATWGLRLEERRLLALSCNMAEQGPRLARSSREQFAGQAGALLEVDVAWLLGPDGRVLHTWSSTDRCFSPAQIHTALAGQTPAVGPGILQIAGEAVLFASSPLPSPEAMPSAPGRLYLARRLHGRLLTKVGTSVPAELMLVNAGSLPEGSVDEQLGHWAVWPLPRNRLAVAWPARDAYGKLLGYFRAAISVPQILNQAVGIRRTILIVLSLSAAVSLLVILGAGIFLANPIGRLVRRLQEVETGGASLDELTDGLHAEPLILAQKLQSALESMSQLSKTDDMTGLANRRQFDHALQTAFHQAHRYRRPLSVMEMDIDLFKAINDTKGHQAGDEVIRIVADVIRSCCRKADLPARLGGDEFAVLLPETPSLSAAVVAERVRKAVVERNIIIDGTEMNVTLSIGIADLEAGKMSKPEDLLGLADEALYAAKQLGRNRFVQAHEIQTDDWADASEEEDRVEMLRGKLAGLDTQFKSLFVRALQEIVQAMERRDPHMADHARKVQHYSSLIGRQLNLSEDLVKQIEMAALLHDIGMLALPDQVLLCPGRLDDEQFAAMQRHPVIGARILEGTEFLEAVIPIVRFHHERFDGKGYPEGLSGLGIPPLCRIVAVADAFDAMTSQRSFRGAMSFQKAFVEIRKGADSQFDPEMVDAFLAAAKKFGPKFVDIGSRRPPKQKRDESPDAEPADAESADKPQHLADAPAD